MADPEFEAKLGRWFAEAPALPDEDWFAGRVQARLERSWVLRRLLIGTAGLAGGLVAAGQMLGAHLVMGRIAGLPAASLEAMSGGARTLSRLNVLADLPVRGEVLWTGAGLAVLAVVFMATRSLEEF